MDATECLENELLARELPTIQVLDLDLGSAGRGRVVADALQRWATELGLNYERCRAVPALGAFRQMAEERVRTAAQSASVVVVFSARTTDQWKQRRTIVGDIAAAQSGVIPVFLGSSAVTDERTAQTLVAEALLRFWGCWPEVPQGPVAEQPSSDRGIALGNAVKEKLAVDPYIVAVGGNEKQQRCVSEFPERLQTEFGVEGEWLLTDYGRPERVVERLKDIHGRLGRRLVAVLFAQFFNATNVKRDGQAFLRSVRVLSITRAFKSTGSALEAARCALSLLVRGGEDDEGNDSAGGWDG